MQKIFCILCLVLIVGSSLIAAPTLKKDQFGFKDWYGGSGRSSFGLLDPSRLTVNHNVSFGFASGGGQSVMQSLYATRFAYKLSDPLTLSVLLGVQNNQFAGNIPSQGSSNSILGGFAIDYRPRKDIYIRLEMLKSPGIINYNTPLYEQRNPDLIQTSTPVDER